MSSFGYQPAAPGSYGNPPPTPHKGKNSATSTTLGSASKAAAPLTTATTTTTAFNFPSTTSTFPMSTAMASQSHWKDGTLTSESINPQSAKNIENILNSHTNASDRMKKLSEELKVIEKSISDANALVKKEDTFQGYFIRQFDSLLEENAKSQEKVRQLTYDVSALQSYNPSQPVEIPSKFFATYLRLCEERVQNSVKDVSDISDVAFRSQTEMSKEELSDALNSIDVTLDRFHVKVEQYYIQLDTLAGTPIAAAPGARKSEFRKKCEAQVPPPPPIAQPTQRQPTAGIGFSTGTNSFGLGFGANTGTSSFGTGTNAAQPFGTAGGLGFGAKPATTGFGFGATTGTGTTGFGFGGNPAPASTGTTGFGFGGNATQPFGTAGGLGFGAKPATTGFGFGTTTGTGTTGFGFGGNPAPASTGTTGFGFGGNTTSTNTGNSSNSKKKTFNSK